MSKALYSVRVVRRELLPLWREFWEADKPTKRAIEANKDGSLGETRLIDARNAKEAEAIAASKNPDHVVIPGSAQGHR